MAKADEWFGSRVRERQRLRARAVAAAQSDAPGAAALLLAAWQREDIPAWRATLLTLLPRTRDAAFGRDVAAASLSAADPLERAAAARYFFGAPDAAERLGPLLTDPVRSVRLEAAWALSPTLPAASPARRELDDYLALTLDQPAGRVRRAQDWANRGRLAEAAAELRRATEWDPFSPGIRQSLGLVLAADGKIADAAQELDRAFALAPDDALSRSKPRSPTPKPGSSTRRRRCARRNAPSRARRTTRTRSPACSSASATAKAPAPPPPARPRWQTSPEHRPGIALARAENSRNALLPLPARARPGSQCARGNAMISAGARPDWSSAAMVVIAGSIWWKNFL
ncbi:hypothetical protein [Oleiharenicola sp. Vm1]|uniref:hypothetical protein n=1 Tax=Oleiharenicola sp. Vm1 TaxID=3398393 RepID=UPI0039F5DCAB